MKTVAFRIIFCLTLLLGTSCSKDSDPESEKYSYPLQVGNSWAMRYTYSEYHHSNNELVTETGTVFTEVLSQVESPLGEQCYQLKQTFNYQSVESYGYQYVAKRAEGLYLLGIGGEVGNIPPLKGTSYSRYLESMGYQPDKDPKVETEWFEVPRLLIPSDCAAGKTWTYQYPYLNDPVTYKVETPSTVTVPAGSFNCHVRKTIYPQPFYMPEELCYFTSCGLVKSFSEYTFEGMDELGNFIGLVDATNLTELLSYELN